MEKDKRAALFVLLAFNLGALLLVALYLILMNIYDSVAAAPFCKFQAVFHLYCPGCGGTRSLRALLHGDLISSFLIYPPIPLSLPVIGYAESLLFIGARRGDPRYILRFNPIALAIPALIVVAFFFIRNALLFAGIDYLGDIL